MVKYGKTDFTNQKRVLEKENQKYIKPAIATHKNATAKDE